MYDLTPAFLAAKGDAHKWGLDVFYRALKLVSDRCPDIEIESRDVEEAGENWARMHSAVKDGDCEHFGIMWSDGPLCFLSPHIAECVGSELTRNGLTIITVDDFDAQRYRIDASVSEYLFGSAWTAGDLEPDPDCFSILDLEWMTK